jgi:hypothetical protein
MYKWQRSLTGKSAMRKLSIFTFLICNLFALSNFSYARSFTKLDCNVVLIKNPMNSSETKETSNIDILIDVIEDANFLSISSINDKFNDISVSGISQRDSIVTKDNLSEPHRWRLQKIEQFPLVAIEEKTTYLIDRNTGDFQYTNFSVKKYISAIGKCKKIDIKKLKF